MGANSEDKDKKIYNLQSNCENLRERLGKALGEAETLRVSIHTLQTLVNRFQPNSKNNIPNEVDATTKSVIEDHEDVTIFHDSLFQHISEGVLKKEGMSVKKIWSPRIEGAYKAIVELEYNPKVIVLHTSTNDLIHLNENKIVDVVMKIYEEVDKRGSKFVYSDIAPRMDNIELNAKAQIINAVVASKLVKKDNAFISRNDNFYNRSVINKDLYKMDGIHLNEQRGSGILAQNTRITICRSLDKELISPKRNRLPQLHQTYQHGR